MMIKCKRHTTYEMERYPEKCSECPAFYQTPYLYMNKRGTEGHCDLGYFHGDMRDYSGNRLYPDCDIKNNKNVIINKKSAKYYKKQSYRPST